jgi:hypothetical protein
MGIPGLLGRGGVGSGSGRGVSALGTAGELAFAAAFGWLCPRIGRVGSGDAGGAALGARSAVATRTSGTALFKDSSKAMSES